MSGAVCDVEPALAVKLDTAEWLALIGGVPGVELHQDRGAVWIVQSGAAWSNAATRLRFERATAGPRLDAILARYRAAGRGAGFWVSPFARPADLEARLARRGLHCRKRFPGMHCDLTLPPPPCILPDGVEIRAVDDYEIFRSMREGHPAIGRITTPIRRFELSRIAHLTARRPQRAWEFIAWRGDSPVGACTLCLSGHAAGLHDVAVVESARRRGIGTALVSHACAFARGLGCRSAVLIASGSGEGVYRRAGFEEVCRIAYWYSSPTALRRSASPAAERF
jgi:GNAT superfamily N-acetyltransferase